MREMLRVHAAAKNRTSIARHLAEAAGYRDYRGFNLQYGLLGKRIGKEMGMKDPGVSLLVDFAEPGSLKNKEWLVFMREEFAEALKRTGWI